MTVVSVEEFRTHFDQYLEATVQGEVVLTRGGKPIAVLQAIPENGDDPFVASKEFWRMIRQRRQERGIPWEEARKQLDRRHRPDGGRAARHLGE